MSRFATPILTFLLLTFFAVVPAQAGLIVTIGNASTPDLGGSVMLDVMIGSSDGKPVNLDGFSFEFMITPEKKNGDQLAFTTTQPQPYMDSRYVFATDSLNGQDTPPDMFGQVSTTKTLNDTYIGGDNASDAGVILSGTTRRLLATLQVTTLTQQPPMYGDVFDISLVQPNSNTYFTYNNSNINVTSNVGNIFVPEPSSAAMTAISLAVAIGITIRRRIGRMLPGAIALQ